MRKNLAILAAGIAFLFSTVCVCANSGFSGKWQIEPKLSSAIDPWSRISLDISLEGNRIIIREMVSAGRRKNSQTYEIDVSKKQNVVPIAWWTGNRHIGAYIGGDGAMKIHAKWLDDGQTLNLKSSFILQTSQGDTPVRTYTEYRLSRDGKRLTRVTLRSTRNRPILHVFSLQ